MKVHDMTRSGNILIITYIDENEERHDTEYVIAYRHFLSLYYDFYEYMRYDDVENGDYAMAVLLDAQYTEDYKIDIVRGYQKNAVLVFAGEEKEAVEKKLRPFIAKKKNVRKTLKIIDFEIAGRQMKLYLGKKETKDYWGDDWNDKPYECNAGTVYDRYVEDTVVVNFPENEDITEICEGYSNSPYSKEDFKNGTAPFAYIPDYSSDENSGWYRSRLDNPKVRKFYFETPVGELYKAGYKITEA